ncbi:MAG: hypothetical protein M1830_003202, partial [Pleopsidium flavum]
SAKSSATPPTTCALVYNARSNISRKNRRIQAKLRGRARSRESILGIWLGKVRRLGGGLRAWIWRVRRRAWRGGMKLVSFF